MLEGMTRRKIVLWRDRADNDDCDGGDYAPDR